MALPSRENAEVQPEAAEADQSHASTAVTSPKLQAPEEPETQPIATATIAHESSSVAAAPQAQLPPQQAHARKPTRTAVPVIPALPAKPAPRQRPTAADAPSTPPLTANPTAPTEDTGAAAPADAQATQAAPDNTAVSSPTRPAAPKSWADLVRAKNAGAAAAAAAAAASPLLNGAGSTNGTGATRASSVAEALKQYKVDQDERTAFLEPRGLVNTGNMCYMNSVRHLSLALVISGANKTARFFKYLYFVLRFTTSWIRSASGLLIRSKVIPLSSMPCKLTPAPCCSASHGPYS